MSRLLLNFRKRFQEKIESLCFEEIREEALKNFINNHKLKKYDEIHFMLEANLKQIRAYLENNEAVWMDKEEMIDYIKSLFEDSANRTSLLNLIEKR